VDIVDGKVLNAKEFSFSVDVTDLRNKIRGTGGVKKTCDETIT